MDSKELIKEAVRRFKGNETNLLTLNIIWLLLTIIAFCCGLLFGAIEYSKQANEFIKNHLEKNELKLFVTNKTENAVEISSLIKEFENTEEKKLLDICKKKLNITIKE